MPSGGALIGGACTEAMRIDEGAKRAFITSCVGVFFRHPSHLTQMPKKKKDNDGQTVKQTKDQVTYRRQHLFRVITYTFAVLSFQSRRGGLCLATHYSFTLAQTSHPKHVAAAVSKSEMRMNKCKEQIGPGGHAFLFPSVISLRRSLAPSIPTSNNATRKTKSNAIMHDLIERHFTRS